MIGNLPPEIVCMIIDRLYVGEKFVLKAVSRQWKFFTERMILNHHQRLSIEQNHLNTDFPSQCLHLDHQIAFDSKNSLGLIPVRADKRRRKFFGENLTNLKVLKISHCRDAERVIKYFISEGPSSRLECLQLKEATQDIVNLPNLRHFSAIHMQVNVLETLLKNCCFLTDITADLGYSYKDFSEYFDLLLTLPRGLKYIKLGVRGLGIGAVLCSPAMETVEIMCLSHTQNSIDSTDPSSLALLKVNKASQLERLTIKCHSANVEQDRLIGHFVRNCCSLKDIDLSIPGFNVVEIIKLYDRPWKLEKINLVNYPPLDGLISVLHKRHQQFLRVLSLGSGEVSHTAMRKLAECVNLQIVSFEGQPPSIDSLIIFARRRLEFSKAHLILKSSHWNETHMLDPLGPALEDAKIELRTK
jgi:hypothetical protein